MAIAFWRCLLGSAATGVWVGLRHRAEMASLTRRQWRLMSCPGCSWGALRDLGAQPGLTWWPPRPAPGRHPAGVGRSPRRPAGRRICGPPRWDRGGADGGARAHGGDSRPPPRLVGDVLALAGGVLAALYVTVGRRCIGPSNPTYTAICYAAAAAGLLGLVAVLRVPLTGFSAATGRRPPHDHRRSTAAGHTVLNGVSHHLGPGRVHGCPAGAAGAALIAAAWLGQVPSPAAWLRWPAARGHRRRDPLDHHSRRPLIETRRLIGLRSARRGDSGTGSSDRCNALVEGGRWRRCTGTRHPRSGSESPP